MFHPTLRQLELFRAVCEHGSITRAAEAMHLTQPAVSIQIRQLSETVGLPLLEQIGKTMHITDAGRQVLAGCRETLDAVNRLESALADLKGLKRGRLRIAVTTTAKYFMPRLLGEFAARHEGIELSLKVTNRAGLLTRLEGNEDDLYVLGQPPEQPAVVAHAFAENPLVVVARPDHPLARLKRIPLERIGQEWFLAREEGSGTRTATERHFAERGVPLRYRMELGSNEAIKQAVIGRLGLALLAKTSVEMELTAGVLQVLPVAGLPIRRDWYLVRLADKKPSIAAQAFSDFLLQGAGRAVPGG